MIRRGRGHGLPFIMLTDKKRLDGDDVTAVTAGVRRGRSVRKARTV